VDDEGASSTEQSRADNGSSSPAGIFDYGFDAYRTVSHDEYRSVLLSGMTVLDANTLLDLYRYHESTREQLLAILTKLGNNLWVPNHAMAEFWHNRANVLEDPKDIEIAIKELDQEQSRYEERIRHWANRVGLSPDLQLQLLKKVTPAFTSLKDELRELGKDDTLAEAGDTSKDPVVTRLASILHGRIGDPTDIEIKRLVREDARQRAKDNRPPGTKDATKNSNAEGDCLVWHETLQEAKRRGTDVLFVTGDVKEDWWRIERGRRMGPHPELAREIRDVAGVRLFMLRPQSLLFHAGKAFSIEVSEATIKDVRRVTTRSDELGILERLAETETNLPSLTERVGVLGRMVEEYGQLVAAATPAMSAAATSSAKLAVANELAEKLSPVAEMFASGVIRYLELVEKVNPGITEMFRQIGYLPSEQRDPDIVRYVDSIKELIATGLNGLNLMMQFHASIGSAIGFSSKLDVPLNQMQSALIMLDKTRVVFEHWSDEVDRVGIGQSL
jgi:predicted nucleic acid-binding protein